MNDKYKLIIFDWDGTLVNSKKCVHKALTTIQNHFGIEPWTEDEMQSKFPSSLDRFLRRNYPDHMQEMYHMFNKVYMEHLAELVIDPYFSEFFEIVKSNGIESCILSNKPSFFVLGELGALATTFTYIVCSNNIAYEKPDPCGIYNILSKYSEQGKTFPKSEILFVGDMSSDRDCAANFGCDFIAIGDRVIGLYNFENLKELIKIIC